MENEGQDGGLDQLRHHSFVSIGYVHVSIIPELIPTHEDVSIPGGAVADDVANDATYLKVRRLCISREAGLFKSSALPKLGHVNYYS